MFIWYKNYIFVIKPRKINLTEVIMPMESPIGRSERMKLVARTQSIEEAERIAQQYELKGYKTSIVKRSQAGIALYEVWAGKEPDILTGKSG